MDKAFIDARVRRRIMRVVADFADEHEALRGTEHGEECGICWPLSEILKMLDADQYREMDDPRAHPPAGVPVVESRI